MDTAVTTVSGMHGTEQNYECAIKPSKESSGQLDVPLQEHLTQPFNLRRAEELDEVNALRCRHDNSRKEHRIDAIEILICYDKLVRPNDVARLAGAADLNYRLNTIDDPQQPRGHGNTRNTIYCCIEMTGEVINNQGVLAAVYSDLEWILRGPIARRPPQCISSLWPSYAPVWWSQRPAFSARYELSGKERAAAPQQRTAIGRQRKSEERFDSFI
ncbi:hypothetical protein MTO96_027032 [Rhipicephalus appendiculatus]